MKPRMQLSDDCPVTPAFRSEINSWMLEFFGYEQDERDEPATTRRLDDANPAHQAHAPLEASQLPLKPV